VKGNFSFSVSGKRFLLPYTWRYWQFYGATYEN